MNSIALWLGGAAMIVGGVLLIAFLLWVGVIAIDHVGSKLWKKLCAYYDIQLIRKTLRELEVQGKTMSKEEQP